MKTKTKGKIRKTGAVVILFLIVLACIAGSITVSAANADLNTATKVSFSVSCNESGFKFALYKLADLVETNVPSFNVKYVATVDTMQSVISAGINEKKDGTLTADMWQSAPQSNAILAAADALSESQLSATEVKQNNTALTYSVTDDGNSKTFSNLDQGIYYLKAIEFPATVKETVNSVISLPYYDSTNGWVYTINSIPLASKVSKNEPAITKKIIRNNNEYDYANESLGDTVTYRIKANRVGSNQYPLTSLVISDIAESGLTLTNSVSIRYLSGSGTVVKEVESTGYSYSKSTGKITFKAAELQSGSLLYSADVIEVTLSATVNKNAVIGSTGNDNSSSYTWTVNGKSETVTDTDEIKVYTQALEITKTDDAGTKLQGAQFEIYSDINLTNKLASGTSDANGKVVFKNTKSERMLFETGTYYVIETKAPDDYNRYSEKIKVDIGATYKDTFSSGTWVNALTAKAQNTNVTMNDGLVSFTVTNSKVVLPQTGGIGNVIIYVIASALLIMGITAVCISRKRKA